MAATISLSVRFRFVARETMIVTHEAMTTHCDESVRALLSAGMT